MRRPPCEDLPREDLPREDLPREDLRATTWAASGVRREQHVAQSGAPQPLGSPTLPPERGVRA